MKIYRPKSLSQLINIIRKSGPDNALGIEITDELWEETLQKIDDDASTKQYAYSKNSQL